MCILKLLQSTSLPVVENLPTDFRPSCHFKIFSTVPESNKIVNGVRTSWNCFRPNIASSTWPPPWLYLHVEFYPHCAFVLDVSRDCFSWKCWATIWPPWQLSRFRPCQHVEFSRPLGALTFVSGDYLRLNLWAWALATLRFPPMSTCWVRPILQKPLFWRLPETSDLSPHRAVMRINTW